jgi:type IV secretory pathway VirB4 component
MTTATVSGAYPFLAEGGLGAEGIFIGRDVHAEAAFCYDPFSLYSSGRIDGFTNPNAVLAGIIGMGKSALAKSIATRAIAHGYKVYVPCDPKGEWSPVAEALGGYSIALGPGLPGRLNPLDAPAKPDAVSEADWATETRKRRLLLLAGLARTVLARDLQPMEHTALDLALDLVVAHADKTGTVPLLGEIAHVLGSPERLDTALGNQAGHMGTSAQDLAHALRRLVHGDLSGMFDAPSTVAFDPATPMLSIDLSRLGGAGDDTALVLAMTCASAWMESALTDPRGGRRWIVYDEAWRLMRHPGLLQRMQSQWKLSRGLGIANLMVIHRLSDLLTAGDAGSRGRALAEGLLADCSTRIIYRQETDQLHAAAALLGLTSVETDAIAHLNRGRGLWKVAGRSFIVQHLLHPHELSLFDTDARMH